MKTIVASAIVAALSLSSFGPTVANAQTSYPGVGTPTPATGTTTQAKNVVTKEPNYVLATVHQASMLAFTRALNGQTVGGTPVDVEFSRAAVGEMRRSFDQMKKYSDAYTETISPEVRAKSTATMQGVETHRTELNAQLALLEEEVMLDKPDANKIATLSASVRTHLDAMSFGSTGMSMKN